MPYSADFVPRLLPAPQAARYLAVSVTTLRTLGIPRVKLGAKRVYDRIDLDAYANELPKEEGTAAEENSCGKTERAWINAWRGLDMTARQRPSDMAGLRTCGRSFRGKPRRTQSGQ